MPREIFHASLPVTEKYRENEMNKNESFSIPIQKKINLMLYIF